MLMNFTCDYNSNEVDEDDDDAHINERGGL